MVLYRKPRHRNHHAQWIHHCQLLISVSIASPRQVAGISVVVIIVKKDMILCPAASTNDQSPLSSCGDPPHDARTHRLGPVRERVEGNVLSVAGAVAAV
jgi:hypothetical protein